MQNKIYADVWGDTVDLKHLAMGMLIGIVIGLSFYLAGVTYLKANYPKLPLNLTTAYALLVGIAGCLLAAVISAKLFPPKRVLNQGKFSDEDRMAVLNELQIDIAKEAEEIKLIDADVAAEMKELQLYDLFTGKPERQKGEK
jgi:multidrug transporter EmrE-like cation transporter